MFTGIIETIGKIEKIARKGSNKSFWINSSISPELKIDQSVSHNGVCLTIEEVKANTHKVTAIKETLNKTNLSQWKEGDIVNLERCIQMNGRLDGHIVQGHTDSTAICKEIKQFNGSWELKFGFNEKFGHLLIEKGSVSLNGISLTLVDVKKQSFKVAIIPYTIEHTNIKNLKKGDLVNIEFDMIGKYIAKLTKAHI